MALHRSEETMTPLTGTPSDEVDAIRACGRSGISRMFLSMAARHPKGDDAGYLAWHTLDHRPEQHRLPGLRVSIRLVSTPECRSVRAVSSPGLDAIDHVMTYFFADESSFAGFETLSLALRDAGRAPFILPPVCRGVYAVGQVRAASHIKAGADVLPWWPAKGVYLVLGDYPLPVDELAAMDGVGGVWSAAAIGTAISSGASATAAPQRLAYCFLEDDPVAVARRIRPVLEQSRRDAGASSSFAAPFHLIVPHEWCRYLP
jgi:hypothetical protein